MHCCESENELDNSDYAYLLVYVDDIITVSTPETCEQVADYLKSEYQMEDFGRPKDFLGFEVDFVPSFEAEDGVGHCLLHQTRYVKELVEKYGLEDARAVSSPWETGVVLSSADTAPEDYDLEFPYRECCGSLIYLRTRPDVTWAVNKLCKWMQNPGPRMVAA